MGKTKNSERRSFLKKSGLCAASFVLCGNSEAMAIQDPEELKRLKSAVDYFAGRNAVMFDILSETLSAEELKEVYGKFGGNCATTYGSVKKTEGYKGNLEKYLEDLPKLDHWQEKAWFDEEKQLITIIGTKREECVCSMARTSKNPNWCHLCCAGHQKAIFENLLDKNVEVTMGETLLLGGERCNHFVQILEV